MQRKRVDLPEPDEPINTVAVWSGTVNDKSLSTTLSSKLFLKFLTSNTFMLRPAHSVA